MFRQIVLLLSAVTVCLALGDGKANYNTKNAFMKQANQYASVASFHSTKSTQAQHQPQAHVASFHSTKSTQAQHQPQVHVAPSPYEFGYEAEGSSRQESADSSGKVTGSYKVTNEDGSVRVVNYIADENGFRADIDTNEPGTKSENPADVALKSAAVEKPYKYTPSSQTFSQSKTSKTHYEQKPIQFNLGSGAGGAAYSYNYEAKLEDGGSSARSESADGSGKVSGFYSMSAADGRKRKVDYSAGSAGFQASVNTNEFGTKSDSPAHVQFLSTAPHQGPAAPSFAHSSSFHQQQQVKSYSSPMVQQQPIQYSSQFKEEKPSPYSFSYDAQLDDGSSSRTEAADASGKVVGSYSLATADGRKRTIDYEADHEGFRASVNTNEFGTKSDSPANVQFYSSAPQEAPAPSTYATAQKTATAPFSMHQSRVSNSAGIKSAFQASSAASSGIKSSYQGQSSVQYGAASAFAEKPQPYSFNYVAQLDDGSSSRSESGDESGKVIGSYSLSAADGRQRTVDYLADQGGFRATVNTNEFGTKADSPADVQFYSSATFDEPAPYFSSNAYKASSSSSSASKYAHTFKTEQQPIQQAPIQFNANNGAYQYQMEDRRSGHSESAYGSGNVRPVQSFQPSPYSFNYEAEATGGSSARKEAADASGTVTGSYTVRNEDGSMRVVDYIADKDGFRANVKTNEPGTKSDHPADVTVKSDAPAFSAPVEQRRVNAHFPARSNTPKSSMISQKSIDTWER